jgi:hypothetical protein
MRQTLFLATIVILGLALATPAIAGDGRSPDSVQGQNPPKKRGKNLEFDDNVVEGMNKNPLDSLQNVGREDGKTHGRLYKKRTDFQNEIRQSVQEAGYSP